MSEILSHVRAAEAVPWLLNKIDAIKTEIVDLENEKNNQAPISTIRESCLEQDLHYSIAEIEILKNAAPNHYLEDENVNYFLAVAEIQKTIEVLRQQLQFGRKNLEGLNNDVKETQALSQNLACVNQELSDAKKCSEIELKKTMDAANCLNLDEQKKMKIDQLHNEEEDITRKIGSTVKAYKEFKNFLQNFLPKIAPPVSENSDSPFAMLLQHLWNVFFGEGVLAYTNIASLPFDVSEEDIQTLMENRIIEVNPKNKEEIRMVDFSH